MKKIFIALLLLLIVAGIGLFVFAGKMDQIVKEAIETEGSAALGSAVRVASVVTNLKEGSAVISNFTIANPAGYNAKNAIEITSFSASVDYLNQVIEKIEINKPVINAEQKGQRNNFQDLLKGIPADEEEELASDESDTLITIKQLALRSATINLVTSDLAIGDKKLELGDRSFVMDDFVLNNLSGTATEISDKVVKRLTSHVSSQVTGYLKKEITAVAKEKLTEKIEDKLGGEVTEKLKGLKFKFGKK